MTMTVTTMNGEVAKSQNGSPAAYVKKSLTRNGYNFSSSRVKLASCTEVQKGALRFEVVGLPGSDFCSFVERNSRADVVRFFREVMGEMETERRVLDFHMKIMDQKDRFFVDIFFGDDEPGPASVPAGGCISCFAEAGLFPGKEPGVTSGECVMTEFSDQPYVQCSLDAKARCGFVITPVRHVERLTHLEDDELFAIWGTAVRALRKDSLPFRTMIMNHGTYRNTPHLHLKVWVDTELHRQVRLNWSSERLDLWRRLLAISGPDADYDEARMIPV